MWFLLSKYLRMELLDCKCITLLKKTAKLSLLCLLYFNKLMCWHWIMVQYHHSILLLLLKQIYSNWEFILFFPFFKTVVQLQLSPNFFPKWWHHVAFHQSSRCSISPPRIRIFLSFNFSHSSGYEAVSHCGFNLYSLMINN